MVSESDASRGRPASVSNAMAFEVPQGWLDYVVACQTAHSAARECAERSFAEWNRSVAFAAQREAEWFDQANRAFAAWYAWWQAAYSLAPGVAPVAGGLSAWWWNSQRALPFAGVV
jgi:hypothetical protein